VDPDLGGVGGYLEKPLIGVLTCNGSAAPTISAVPAANTPPRDGFGRSMRLKTGKGNTPENGSFGRKTLKLCCHIPERMVNILVIPSTPKTR
jgi:hypothetical protein